MATAGTVTIQLDGNSARLVRELNKANRKTRSFASRAKQDLTAVAKSLAFIGTAAIAGLGLLTRNALKSADALAKQADKLGLSTEKLAGLQLAAKLTGVEQNTLNKALTRQQKAIVDATNGLSTYIRAFDALNLDANELINLTVDEQFNAIAGAMSGVSNQTERVSIAYDIFGGRATDLLNTLLLGADGIAAVTKEAELLGIAINRVDAKQIENANDAATRAAAALKGVGNNIAIFISPFLEKMSNDFTESLKSSRGLKEEIEGIVAPISVVVAAVRNIVAGFQFAVTGVKLLFAQIDLSLRDIGTATGEVSADAKIIGDELQDTRERFRGTPFGFVIETLFGDGTMRGQVIADIDTAGDKVAELLATLEGIQFVGGAEVAAELAEITADALERARAEIEGRERVIPVTAIVPTPEELRTAQQNLVDAATIAATEAATAQKAIRDALLADELASTLATQQLLTELLVVEATRRVEAQLEAEKAAREAAGLDPEGLDPVEKQRLINDELLNLARQTAKERLKITAETSKAETKIVAAAERFIQGLRKQTVGLSIRLLQSFAGKSKAFAIAAIVAEKAAGIASVLISSRQAAMAAFAPPPIGLGPKFGAPLAAQMLALGRINAALIAAQGIGQIASLGGGGAGLGTPANPITTTPSGIQPIDQGPIEGFTGQSAVQVTIQGNFIGNEENIAQLVDAIREAIDERDVVIIGSQSRQAIELVGEGA